MTSIEIHSSGQMSFDENVHLIRQVLEIRNIVRLPFQGTSMLPAIDPGSLLTIGRVTDLRIGNIYVFIDTVSPTKRLVCHRLQRYEDGLYIFKGDNRKWYDQPVAMESIIGEVISWN